jgi:hypothetical protein
MYELVSATNRPVSSLFITSGVTGEVLRMMDCGKQAAKSTIPVLLVFAFLLAEWEAETNITNSATAFEKLKLVEAGQRFANSASPALVTLALLEC